MLAKRKWSDARSRARDEIRRHDGNARNENGKATDAASSGTEYSMQWLSLSFSLLRKWKKRGWIERAFASSSSLSLGFFSAAAAAREKGKDRDLLRRVPTAGDSTQSGVNVHVCQVP